MSAKIIKISELRQEQATKSREDNLRTAWAEAFARQDFESAFKYLLELASLTHNAEHLSTLGDCYSGGVGCPRDLEAGVRFYQEAVKIGGFPTASMQLGLCYVNGHGIEQDVAKGVPLLLDAYRTGEARAGYPLIQCAQFYPDITQKFIASDELGDIVFNCIEVEDSSEESPQD
jgi:TPR repeat protein